MFTQSTNLLGALLIFSLTQVTGQTTQDQQLLRGINTKRTHAIRFVSQPVTTKPTQFFEQQPQFRQQNRELGSNQFRVLQGQEDFRKSLPQTNTVRDQRFQQNSISGHTQLEVPVNRQQNFLDSRSNFNTPEQPTFQQSFTQQQFGEPIQRQQQAFQGTVFPGQNGQQEYSRTRLSNQQVTIRRPTERQQTSSFVATQPSRSQESQSPESIIRSLADVQTFDTQDTTSSQNNGFIRTNQRTNTGLRQRTQSKGLTDDDEFSREQAQSAKYSFTSEVNDGINDNNHVRAETRDGLKLSGVYSYSDGFFKRTVNYEADENGYRVVKEESEPIGNGPQTNPTGTADVSSSVDGANIQYSIRGEEVLL